MIIGLGSDIVNITRIAEMLKKHGQQFEKRVYTEQELKAAYAYKNNPETYAAFLAKRFAAKEAAVKALGTGFGEHATLTDVSVCAGEKGKPQLHLDGAAYERLISITPEDASPRMHISLSDDFPSAFAFVIIEAIPDFDD